MKFRLKKMPFVGFGFFLLALIALIIGYALTFKTYQLDHNSDPNRLVVILPIFAIWILLIQLVMSFIDDNRPVWLDAINVVYCFLVLFAFGKFISGFLEYIGIYYTVHEMGDVATMEAVVPKAILASVFLIVSCVLFIVGSFFKVYIDNKKKEEEAND